MELPKTEDELQSLIDNAVKEATEALESKHNGAIASIRKDYDKKLNDYKESQKLSDEERATKLAQEKEKELNDELNDLRSFKKSTILKERLVKEGLPTYLANDNRLINAEDGELDKVIKVVKGDYEANLPKGNTHSTVVPTNTVAPSKGGNEKGFDEFAQQLKNLNG